MGAKIVGTARVIAGVGLGLVLSGCAAPAPTESGPTQSSPTAAGETGAAVAACSNDDVEATLGEWDGAGGQIVGFVVFAARTERPCMLAGAPQLRLIDANGHVIAEAAEQAPAAGDPSIELVPGTGPPAPRGFRAGQASFMFLLGNVCQPVADGRGRVEVRLPGESEVLAFATEIPAPACTARGRPPFLGVRPFASPIPD